MKLQIDEMLPPVIAVELRRRGHDVVAVVERRDLRMEPDDVIFAVAQTEGRAVLTENVDDFLMRAQQRLGRGESHAGLILTTPHRFPRGHPRTIGRLVTALDALLASGFDATDLEHWLR